MSAAAAASSSDAQMNVQAPYNQDQQALFTHIDQLIKSCTIKIQAIGVEKEKLKGQENSKAQSLQQKSVIYEKERDQFGSVRRLLEQAFNNIALSGQDQKICSQFISLTHHKLLVEKSLAENDQKKKQESLQKDKEEFQSLQLKVNTLTEYETMQTEAIVNLKLVHAGEQAMLAIANQQLSAQAEQEYKNKLGEMEKKLAVYQDHLAHHRPLLKTKVETMGEMQNALNKVSKQLEKLIPLTQVYERFNASFQSLNAKKRTFAAAELSTSSSSGKDEIKEADSKKVKGMPD